MRISHASVLLFATCIACGGKNTDTDSGDAADSAADGDTTSGDGDTAEGMDADTTDTADTADTTADTADTSEDDGFVPGEDIPSIASCDPFAQDCPEGEKCVAYASAGGTWDANKCVMVTGEGSDGDQCVYDGAAEGTDDCNEDTVCWNALEVDGQLVGTCHPFCSGSAQDPTCDDPDSTCRIVNDGAINLCLPRCDPLLQECTPGLGCYWSGGSGTFQCIIVAGDGIPTGEPCGFNNDCAPGHFCADAAALENCNGSACCAVFCDLTEDPSPCDPAYQCVAFFEEGMAPPEYESLGLCILPG